MKCFHLIDHSGRCAHAEGPIWCSRDSVFPCGLLEFDLETAEVNSPEDLVTLIGPGFHPDTQISDYVCSDKLPSFSDARAIELQAKMDGWHADWYKIYNNLFPS